MTSKFIPICLTDQEVQWLYDHPGQTLSCTPPPSGLVSWWKAENNFDDAYGGNNGTGQNGATFATGKVSQAFSFDGVDDYVECWTSIGCIPTTGRDIFYRPPGFKPTSVERYYNHMIAAKGGQQPKEYGLGIGC